MSVAAEVLSTHEESLSEEQIEAEEQGPSSALKVLGWLSVGVAVAAVGLYVGRELRNRYKFNHRTPYDFYANAGKRQAGEFGLGI